MAGLVTTDADSHLAAWLAADLAVASGQSYTIGGRTLTRANADEIRRNITYWHSMAVRLKRGGALVVRGVTPV